MRLYRRARREDEKTDRIEAILASAKNLLTTNTLDECNLSIIASDVGITKAALYRYFRVKELIFLEIYRRELAILATALQEAFINPQVATLVDVLVKQPIFCKLTSELGDVLEKPLTEEEAADFKLYVLQTFEPLSQQLSQQFGMTHAQVTTAADIYSLGRLLEKILPPADGDAELQAIVARATAREPADRYATVDALRASGTLTGKHLAEYVGG